MKTREELEKFKKELDDMLHAQSIKAYNYIVSGEETILKMKSEKKKDLLDTLISHFKKIGDNDKVKYLEGEKFSLAEGVTESDSGGSGKCVIRLVSIRTAGDIDSWGNDSHYYHDVVVKIDSNIDDEDEKLVLEKISKGEYSLEGDEIWCSELEAPLAKANIMKLASSSDSLYGFTQDVMEDMYESLVGWCHSKWPSLNKREISKIALAISDPMFGSEDVYSESKIDFIED